MIALRKALATLLAADAATLAPAVNGNKIALVVAPFANNEGLVAADLTLATFTGSTPLQLGTGTQNVGTDPATGQQVIALLLPAGGLRWICTVAPSPGQTVYGYALFDSTLATLLAVQQLATPIPIAAVGDQVVLDPAEVKMVVSPWAA